MKANSKITKSISALLIILIILPAFLFSTPQQVTAQGFVPVNDAQGNILNKAILKATGGSLVLENKSWIEYLGIQILKMVAKRILAQMTQATVNWINSGFHGAPLFLENPESFFKDIRKSVVRSIVDMIGYDDFRFPFGKQTALNVIESYKSQLETNAQYTLYNVLNNQDLVDYRTDFNVGGWNGFLINTQYPQNNYLGFNMIIGESLGSQLAGTLQAPAEKVQSLLQQGMGFLSPQTCPTNPRYNNGVNEFLKPSFKPTTKFVQPTVSYEDPGYLQANDNAIRTYEYNKAEEKASWEIANTCPGGLVSTTPGFVAATQISNALDSPRMMTVLDGALGNSFAAIFDALINKLLSDGLNALASTVNSVPENDIWSYEGQTLDSGTATSTVGGLNINYSQHNVSINVGTFSTKTISGGIGPYSIQQPSPLNTNIASVAITNSATSATLRIDGKGISGETSVVIQDSSDPEKSTIINIEVNNPNEIVTSPRAFTEAFSINTNDTASARILGGTKPYSIETSPDQAIAIAGIADNILIVSGVAAGTTSARIKDLSGKPPYEVIITITESSTLQVSQESILLSPGGQTAVREIPFNNPNTTNTNLNVASVDVNGATLTFTSKNVTGQTKITVTGPNNTIQNPQIVEFHITVAAPLTYGLQRYRGGAPVANTTPLQRSTEYIAFISGGLLPYSVASYSSEIFTAKPRFLTGTSENRLYFVINSSAIGSGVINVVSASDQTVTINITVN